MELKLKNTQENWASVPEFEGLYEVSDNGNVRSVTRSVTQLGKDGRYFTRPYYGRVLIPRKAKNGYLYLSLSKDGVSKTKKIHRLVAICFVENVNGKQYVNHIDGDKVNNCAWNLEWVTHRENITHSIDKGLTKPNEYGKNARSFKGVILAIKNGKVVAELEGAADMIEKGFTPCGVSATMTNRQKTHRSCVFVYKGDENEH